MPWTLRPLVLRCTVNLTELASERLNETLVPTCALAIDGPDLAALNVVLENESASSAGFVLSGVEPGPPGGPLPGPHEEGV